jgi:hypothetical protein
VFAGDAVEDRGGERRRHESLAGVEVGGTSESSAVHPDLEVAGCVPSGVMRDGIVGGHQVVGRGDHQDMQRTAAHAVERRDHLGEVAVGQRRFERRDRVRPRRRSRRRHGIHGSPEQQGDSRDDHGGGDPDATVHVGAFRRHHPAIASANNSAVSTRRGPGRLT